MHVRMHTFSLCFLAWRGHTTDRRQGQRIKIWTYKPTDKIFEFYLTHKLHVKPKFNDFPLPTAVCWKRFEMSCFMTLNLNWTWQRTSQNDLSKNLYSGSQPQSDVWSLLQASDFNKPRVVTFQRRHPKFEWCKIFIVGWSLRDGQNSRFLKKRRCNWWN